jgi:signal transduction histidine kinase
VSAAASLDTRSRALASLGAMTATVAHELRNLLGGIDLYATLVAEQCAADRDLAPLTSRLLDGVKRLHAVAANILAVGRPQHAVAELARVDLVRLVDEVADDATLATRGTGIHVLRRSNAAKADVAGDGEGIRQALLNLVINAAQAMPAGGTLTIGTRVIGDVVEVSVRDTGAGMEPATLKRAFEPFFTTRAHGTGLGLAVVRDVADAHRARVRVTSRPGRGSTFRLTFALARAGGVS